MVMRSVPVLAAGMCWSLVCLLASCSLDIEGTAPASAFGGTDAGADVDATTLRDAEADGDAAADAGLDAAGRDASPDAASADAGADAAGTDAGDGGAVANCSDGGACYALAFTAPASPSVSSALTSTMGDFTLEAFVKPSSLSTTTDLTDGDRIFGAVTDIGGTYFSETQNEYWAQLYQSGVLTLVVGSTATGGGQHTDSNRTVPAGTWSHVAVTRSLSNGHVDVYIDGQSVGSTTDNNEMTLNSAATFYVGPNFNGVIDDVRVWSVVRGAAQIATDATEATLTLPSPDLVLYWKFDEGSGSTTKDWSATDGGAGNTGTLNGNLTWVVADR
jgi:hypothetical protein